MSELEMEKYRLQFNVLHTRERMKNHVVEIKEFFRPKNLVLHVLDRVTGGWSQKVNNLVETYTEEGSTIDRVAKSDIMQYAPISVALGYRVFKYFKQRQQKKRLEEYEKSLAG